MKQNFVANSFGHSSDSRSYLPNDNLIDSSVFVGIEIEIEGLSPSQLALLNEEFKNSDFISITSDPSLRMNGREFKFGTDNGPICGQDLVNTIEFFCDTISPMIINRNIKYDLPDNFWTERESLHLHLDVRDLSKKQIILFRSLYFVFEPIFISLFGLHERVKHSPYCTTIESNSEYQKRVRDSLRIGSFQTDPLVKYISSCPKYQSINEGAVATFGSIEFRMFYPIIDKELFIKIINMFLYLKLAAKNDRFEFKSIAKDISGLGFNNFIHEIMPNYSNEIIEKVPNKEIVKGVRRVEWINFSLSRVTTQPPKIVDRLSNHHLYKVFKEMPKENRLTSFTEFKNEFYKYDYFAGSVRAPKNEPIKKTRPRRVKKPSKAPPPPPTPTQHDSPFITNTDATTTNNATTTDFTAIGNMLTGDQVVFTVEEALNDD